MVNWELTRTHVEDEYYANYSRFFVFFVLSFQTYRCYWYFGRISRFISLFHLELLYKSLISLSLLLCHTLRLVEEVTESLKALKTIYFCCGVKIRYNLIGEVQQYRFSDSSIWPKSQAAAAEPESVAHWHSPITSLPWFQPASQPGKVSSVP